MRVPLLKKTWSKEGSNLDHYRERRALVIVLILTVTSTIAMCVGKSRIEMDEYGDVTFHSYDIKDSLFRMIYDPVLIVSFGMDPLEGSLTLLCSFLLYIGVRQSRSLLILPCLLLLVTELFVSLSQAIVTIPKISDKDEVLLTRTIAIVIFVVLFVKFLMTYYVWDVYEEKKIKEVALSFIK